MFVGTAIGPAGLERGQVQGDSAGEGRAQVFPLEPVEPLLPLAGHEVPKYVIT